MTEQELEKYKKNIRAYAGFKGNYATPLPADLSSFETPPMEDMFKMMAILQNGTSIGWENIRQDFIKNVSKVPNSNDSKQINATLLNAINNQGTVSAEDSIMNDFSMDTNAVIQQIQDGTVDITEGKEKFEKMQMIEGDMPGQGKEKQGNWRG